MLTLNLQGRVAVVVGGTSGLGRAIALGFAEAGADVVATGRRADLVETVSAEIEKLGRRTVRFPVDVLSRKSLDDLRDAVVKGLGGADVLVNAAGRMSNHHKYVYQVCCALKWVMAWRNCAASSSEYSGLWLMLSRIAACSDFMCDCNASSNTCCVFWSANAHSDSTV